MKHEIDQVRELFQAQQPGPEAKAVPEEVEVPEELLIDTDEETEAVEAADQEAPEETEEGTEAVTEEADTAESYTVSSLAEAIGWEAKDLYTAVEVPMDNGETVPLGELKNEYQNTIRERDTLKTQLEQAQGQAGQAQQVSQEMIQAMAQREAIINQYQQVNWEQLEQEDAGKAALHKQKFQTAFNQAEDAINGARQVEQQARQQMLAAAADEMLKMIPEWQDATTRDAEQAKIRDAMHTSGYGDDIINSISDPRALTVWRELVLLREEKAAAQGAVKKVRKAPKVLKGAARVSTAPPKPDARKLREKVRNARPGDRRKVEFDAVKQLMGG
ncbi:hypothetical protein K0U83_26805 [bacterium]|nr:hypothetical protein [bacterium]